MHHHTHALIAAAIVTSVITSALTTASAQTIGTAFTYQGEITQAEAPAGPVDLRFRLFDAPTVGAQIGPQLSATNVTPANGRFAVTLDFGAGIFAGSARYLEIQVAVAGSNSYTILSPRQNVTPAPYALFAANVSPTAVPWSFSGTNAIFTGGNVGAGTAAPSARLHVSGSDPGTGLALNVNNNLYVRPSGSFVGVNRTTSVTGAEFFGVDAPISGALFGGMYIRTTSATGKPFYGYTNVGGATAYHYLNGPDGAWRFNIGGSDRLTVSPAGNLGLGTTSPATPLDITLSDKSFQVRFDGVSPGINLAGSGGNLGILRVRNKIELWPDDGALRAGAIDIRNTAGAPTISADGANGNFAINGTLTIDAASANDGTLSTPAVRLGASSGEAILSRRTAGANQFGLDLLTAAAPRLSITNAGNVGIGTQAPAATLDVAGTLRVSQQGTFNAAPGTSPFTVASTTRVTNLNADLLDGLDSSAFLTSVPNPLGLTNSVANGYVVRGTNSSFTNLAAGVAGIHTSASSTVITSVYGVYGETASGNSSAGVYGRNTRTGATTGNGVFGTTSADVGIGVYGYATSSAAGASGVGVKGKTAGSAGIGVLGEADGDAVYGSSVNGAGVRAYSINGGTALYGERTANGNKGWFGGLNEGGWAEASTGNGFVAITGSGSQSGLYCANNGGGNALYAQGKGYISGELSVAVITIRGGADLAEPFDVRNVSSESPLPGMLVSIDPKNPGKLSVAHDAYDRKVAGVISGANGLSAGMVLKSEHSPLADGEFPVAMTGRVWCYADASNVAIEPGDRLTTSATPGHAMRVDDETRAPGAVIGKAMTPLARGETGLVLVLVNLQ